MREDSSESSSDMADGMEHYNTQMSVGDKSQREVSKEEMLCRAALSGDTTECMRLLSSIKDVNWRRPGDGNSALHLAAETGHAAVVRALMAAGASSEIMNNYGLKPIALVDLGTEVYRLLDGVTSLLPDTRDAHRQAVMEAARA
mmetsp:Transcript_42543/g.97523  ORF Transcript_42543/g.97523 Transcript_42543/m.97523 type:complete len:144 (-) Transcript_42543:71-502(-)